MVPASPQCHSTRKDARGGPTDSGQGCPGLALKIPLTMHARKAGADTRARSATFFETAVGRLNNTKPSPHPYPMQPDSQELIR